ncbi:MAG: hypothetical protein V4527_18425 [Pseudomonadota bacterium]
MDANLKGGALETLSDAVRYERKAGADAGWIAELEQARRQVAELAQAAKGPARDLRAAITAMEFSRHFIPEAEWTRLNLDGLLRQFERNGDALRAALAAFPEAK